MLTKIKHEFPFYNIQEFYHTERTFIWNDVSHRILNSVVGRFQFQEDVFESVLDTICNNSIGRRNANTN